MVEAADSQGGLFYVTRGGADIHFLPREFPKPLHLGAISFVVRVVGEPHEIGQTFAIEYRIVDADARCIDVYQAVSGSYGPADRRGGTLAELPPFSGLTIDASTLWQ